MGAKPSIPTVALKSNDFSRLTEARRGRGIEITEAYDSDVDDDIKCDLRGLAMNASGRGMLKQRRDTSGAALKECERVFRDLIKTIDGDGDGQVDYAEFREWINSGIPLAASFRRECRKALGNLVTGEPMSRPATDREVFDWLDKDGQGTLDLAELGAGGLGAESVGTGEAPECGLDFVYGYRGADGARQSVQYTASGDICYITGGTVVTYVHAGGATVSEMQEDVAAGDGEQIEPHKQCGYLDELCNADFVCLAIHPDKTTAAVGEVGPRAVVYIFNAYTMEVQAKITSVPDEGVSALDFAADGALLATCGMDVSHTMTVYDVQKLPELSIVCTMPATRADPMQRVFALRWNTNEDKQRRFITCAYGQTKVWNVDVDESEMFGSALHFGQDEAIQTIVSVTSDPKGDTICGSKAGDVLFFKGTNLDRVEKAVHSGPVTCTHSEERPWSVGGPILFTCGKDGVLQEWRVKEDSFEYLNEVVWWIGRRFEPGMGGIRSLTLLPASGMVAFGTRKGGVYEFRFGDTGENVEPTDVLDDSFSCLLEPLLESRPDASTQPLSDASIGGIKVALHPKKLFMVTADHSNVREWDMIQRTLRRKPVTVLGGSSISAMHYEQSVGDILAIGLQNGMLCLYDSENLECRAVAKNRSTRLTVVRFSPDGNLLAVGTECGEVDVFDVHHTPGDPHAGSITLINTCKPSPMLGMREEMQSEAVKKQTAALGQGHTTCIKAIDWSTDSKRLKTVCENSEVMYWEVGLFRGNSGTPITPETARGTDWGSYSSALGWQSTGVFSHVDSMAHIVACTRPVSKKWMAIGDLKGAITLFPFPCLEGEMVETLEIHHHTVRLTDLQVSADEQFLVSAGIDGVCQWKIFKDESKKHEAETLEAQLEHARYNEKKLQRLTGESTEPVALPSNISGGSSFVAKLDGGRRGATGMLDAAEAAGVMEPAMTAPLGAPMTPAEARRRRAAEEEAAEQAAANPAKGNLGGSGRLGGSGNLGGSGSLANPSKGSLGKSGSLASKGSLGSPRSSQPSDDEEEDSPTRAMKLMRFEEENDEDSPGKSTRTSLTMAEIRAREQARMSSGASGSIGRLSSPQRTHRPAAAPAVASKPAASAGPVKEDPMRPKVAKGGASGYGKGSFSWGTAEPAFSAQPDLDANARDGEHALMPEEGHDMYCEDAPVTSYQAKGKGSMHIKLHAGTTPPTPDGEPQTGLGDTSPRALDGTTSPRTKSTLLSLGEFDEGEEEEEED